MFMPFVLLCKDKLLLEGSSIYSIWLRREKNKHQKYHNKEKQQQSTKFDNNGKQTWRRQTPLRIKI